MKSDLITYRVCNSVRIDTPATIWAHTDTVEQNGARFASADIIHVGQGALLRRSRVDTGIRTGWCRRFARLIGTIASASCQHGRSVGEIKLSFVDKFVDWSRLQWSSHLQNDHFIDSHYEWYLYIRLWQWTDVWQYSALMTFVTMLSIGVLWLLLISKFNKLSGPM